MYASDMHDKDYLIVDPACEGNKKGTRDKNERVEVDDETLSHAKEDWDCPEQTEVDEGVQPDFPFIMETCQGK